MKYAEVKLGQTYRARISGATALVKIVRPSERGGRKVFVVVREGGTGKELIRSAAALHSRTPRARAQQLAGYTDCGCRDCFEIAIGVAGEAFCHACEEAGCEKDAECQAQRDDADAADA